jgi:hypothetical protein
MRNFKIDISKCDPKQSIKYVMAQKMSKMGLGNSK